MALSLDLETAPRPGFPQEYALQPWRYLEYSAYVTCLAVAKSNGEALLRTSNYRTVLQTLTGQTVYTWNGIFDVAWLIAMGYWKEVKAITWVDSMVLWKWVDNAQCNDRIPAWSLIDGACRWLADWPLLDKFVAMKKAGDVPQGSEYWKMRGKLDAIVTSMISDEIIDTIEPKQFKTAMVGMENIPEIARSWVNGVGMDFSLIDHATPVITKEMRDLEFRLGVSNFKNEEATLVIEHPELWAPSTILRSPKQLSELLFEKWNLTPTIFSEKTGQPSTNKTALTYLADQFDRIHEILRWRILNTQLTKYIQSPCKARTYLKSDVLHPSPRMFSTYTGRFTYTSKTAMKFHTGMSLHQWPRNKEFRALIVPPKGKKHVEYDAAGQESRIMAHQSGDVAMQHVFKQGMKIHAVTGAKIAGISYEAFMDGQTKNNKTITGEHGLYYQGKFTNLSSHFRIGLKKLRTQARVQYGMDVDYQTVDKWSKAFHTSFPCIKNYWSKSIANGRAMGYAESLGGRRFGLNYWGKDDRWSTESSAIMHPIQGTGADMKELGIRELARHYPDFMFWFDLHDGLHMLVDEDVPNSRLLEARDMLDNIDYKAEWNVDLQVPLLWDCSVGPRWSELKELK